MRVYYNPYCNGMYVMSYFNSFDGEYVVLCEYDNDEKPALFRIHTVKFDRIVKDLIYLGKL